MASKRIKSVEASLADSGESGHSLKRSLGVWDLTLLGVAVAIGAGIFSVGANAAGNYAGPSVSVAFVLAAVTAGLAIMCYAEFASAVPVAGSAYTYTYATMGELLAWIIGWDLILEMLMASAVIAKYWGIYLTSVFDLAGLHVADTINIFGIKFGWASVLITAVFTTLLVIGTKLSSRVSAVLTVLKVGVVLFIVVVGAFFINPSNYTPFVPPAEPRVGGESDVWTQSLVSFMTGSVPSQYGFFGLLAAASLVFFAFIGFDVVATSAEEVKNPQRTLPRGIFAGLAIVTLLYVAVTLVLTGMVPYTTLANTPNASLATAFVAVGANWAAQVISVGTLIGLTTVLLVVLLGLARVVFAMSRDGLLPRMLSVTNPKRSTPVRVQVIVGAVVALIAGFTDVGLLEEMINIGTLSAFVLVSIGVVVLRRIRPDIKAAFRVPWSPWIPLLSAVLAFWLMLNLTTVTWVRFLVWLAIGLVIYFSYGRRHSLIGRQEGVQDRVTVAGKIVPPVGQ